MINFIVGGLYERHDRKIFICLVDQTPKNKQVILMNVDDGSVCVTDAKGYEYYGNHIVAQLPTEINEDILANSIYVKKKIKEFKQMKKELEKLTSDKKWWEFWK